MRTRFPRRPSPAMLVAVTALVSSFAGPAVADEVARVAQSLTSSNQIRNGIVTGADIRNESVTSTDVLNGSVRTEDIGTFQVQTPDLAPDSVRGDKIPTNTIDSSDVQDRALRGEDLFANSVGGTEILEATLGTVPRAASVESLTTFRRTVRVGERATLVSTGSLSVVGRCDDDGGDTAGTVLAASSKNGAFFAGSDDENADFGAGTAEADREFRSPAASASGGSDVSDGFDDQFVVGHRDGEFISGSVHTLADDAAAQCTFLGKAAVR